MPGINNTHRSRIQKHARFLRITHLENNSGSLYMSDLDTPENKSGNSKIPVYLPFGQTLDLLLADRVLASYQQGSIRGYIKQNLIDVWIVQNVEVEEGKGVPVPVYDAEIDESLITIDSSAGDVLVNLPDILGGVDIESVLPEGSRIAIKKISNDANDVIIMTAPGDLIEGTETSYILTTPLDLVILQSDDRGNWWVLGCGCNEGGGGGGDIVDRSLLSHYNNDDGTNDASVTGPVFLNHFIASPVNNLYGVGGWDDRNLHPVTRSANFSYVNDEEATDLEEGVIKVLVSYYDGQENLLTQTLSFSPGGQVETESVDGIEVSISGLVGDLTSVAGYITTTITPLDLPSFSEGGRIESFSTTHTVKGVPYSYENVTGVFVDAGPTPPQNENNPNVVVLTEVVSPLSGVPYYNNGTQVQISQGFLNTFNRTYIQNPFSFDARILAQGLGQGSIAYNNIAVSKPNAFPEQDDRADLNLVRTLSGNTSCSTGGSVSTVVRDPWGSSTAAFTTLNDTLFYNGIPAATRNFEGLLGEGRRLQASSDNTTPDDRDLGNWLSSGLLNTEDDGLGLQVSPCIGSCQGVLHYPSLDYTTYAPTGPDYSNLSGQSYEGQNDVRWYYRFFSNSSGVIQHSGGVLRIDLCNGNLSSQDLLDDLIFVEVMLCNPSSNPSLGGRSGWLSLNRNFNNAVFDPEGPSRVERGCLTMTSETNSSTDPPNFGFTLSSNNFPYFTSLDSNYGVRVRIGIRPDQPYSINGMTMVGW
jgi:hypothetical protein